LIFEKSPRIRLHSASEGEYKEQSKTEFISPAPRSRIRSAKKYSLSLSKGYRLFTTTTYSANDATVCRRKLKCGEEQIYNRSPQDIWSALPPTHGRRSHAPDYVPAFASPLSAGDADMLWLLA